MLHKFLFIVALITCFSLVSLGANAASNNQPLTGSDLKEATEMNDLYARHMYSSTCVERQKALHVMSVLTADEQSKRVAGFKNTCDCITDAILKQVTPNDLINYVTDMDGTFPPGVKTRPKPDPVVVKKYAQIAAINREIRTRNQCGFKQ